KQLARVLPILHSRSALRRRYSLRTWIENTWVLLGGPATVETLFDLDDVEAYFNLLDTLDVGGDLIQIDRLDELCSHLFASPSTDESIKVQIMTIHNAKGLEFDHVILPHLERKAPSDDKQLLLWMERPREKSDSIFMLAPVHASFEKIDPIYHYIKKQ